MRGEVREYLRARDPWSPVNPLALFYRHLFEEELTRLFREERIELAGKKIIEAGCGTGEKTRLLIELGAGPRDIHAFDKEPENVARAAATINGPSFAVADGRDLPYPDRTFDAAVLFLYMSVLEPAGVRPRAAAEIRRVLKEDGFVLWYDTTESGGGYLWGLGKSEIRGFFPGYKARLISFGLRYRRARHTVYKSFELARLLAKSGLARSHLLGTLTPGS